MPEGADGYIADSSDWMFTSVTLHIADNSTVALSDSAKVTAIETHSAKT